MNDSSESESDDVPYQPGCLQGWDLKVGPAAPTSEDSTSSTTSGSEGGMEDRSDDVRYRPGYVPPTPNELLSDSDPETSEEDSEESSLDQEPDATSESSSSSSAPPTPPRARRSAGRTRPNAKRFREE